MRIIPFLLIVFWLIACNNAAKKDSDTKDTTVTVKQIPAQPSIPDTIFTGFGNEPFWAVYVIKDSKILFHPADGPDVEVPYRAAVSGTGSIMYNSTGNGNSIDLTIIKKDCSDGMSDITHSYEVTLVVNKTKYAGCGRNTP